jgi:hypothetical protein
MDGLVLKLRNALRKAAAGPPALSNATGLDGYLQCSSPVRGEFIIAWTDIAGLQLGAFDLNRMMHVVA